MNITISQSALVAALAAARGMSLRDLEAQLGEAPGALSKALELGALPLAGARHATDPAQLTAEAVAKALGVEVDVLVGEGAVRLNVANDADRAQEARLARYAATLHALLGRAPADPPMLEETFRRIAGENHSGHLNLAGGGSLLVRKDLENNELTGEPIILQAKHPAVHVTQIGCCVVDVWSGVAAQVRYGREYEWPAEPLAHLERLALQANDAPRHYVEHLVKRLSLPIR